MKKQQRFFNIFFIHFLLYMIIMCVSIQAMESKPKPTIHDRVFNILQYKWPKEAKILALQYLYTRIANKDIIEKNLNKLDASPPVLYKDEINNKSFYKYTADSFISGKNPTITQYMKTEKNNDTHLETKASLTNSIVEQYAKRINEYNNILNELEELEESDFQSIIISRIEKLEQQLSTWKQIAERKNSAIDLKEAKNTIMYLKDNKQNYIPELRSYIHKLNEHCTLLKSHTLDSHQIFASRYEKEAEELENYLLSILPKPYTPQNYDQAKQWVTELQDIISKTYSSSSYTMQYKEINNEKFKSQASCIIDNLIRYIDNIFCVCESMLNEHVSNNLKEFNNTLKYAKKNIENPESMIKLFHTLSSTSYLVFNSSLQTIFNSINFSFENSDSTDTSDTDNNDDINWVEVHPQNTITQTDSDVNAWLKDAHLIHTEPLTPNQEAYLEKNITDLVESFCTISDQNIDEIITSFCEINQEPANYAPQKLSIIQELQQTFDKIRAKITNILHTLPETSKTRRNLLNALYAKIPTNNSRPKEINTFLDMLPKYRELVQKISNFESTENLEASTCLLSMSAAQNLIPPDNENALTEQIAAIKKLPQKQMQKNAPDKRSIKTTQEMNDDCNTIMSRNVPDEIKILELQWLYKMQYEAQKAHGAQEIDYTHLNRIANILHRLQATPPSHKVDKNGKMVFSFSQDSLITGQDVDIKNYYTQKKQLSIIQNNQCVQNILDKITNKAEFYCNIPITNLPKFLQNTITSRTVKLNELSTIWQNRLKKSAIEIALQISKHNLDAWRELRKNNPDSWSHDSNQVYIQERQTYKNNLLAYKSFLYNKPELSKNIDKQIQDLDSEVLNGIKTLQQDLFQYDKIAENFINTNEKKTAQDIWNLHDQIKAETGITSGYHGDWEKLFSTAKSPLASAIAAANWLSLALTHPQMSPVNKGQYIPSFWVGGLPKLWAIEDFLKEIKQYEKQHAFVLKRTDAINNVLLFLKSFSSDNAHYFSSNIEHVQKMITECLNKEFFESIDQEIRANLLIQAQEFSQATINSDIKTNLAQLNDMRHVDIQTSIQTFEPTISSIMHNDQNQNKEVFNAALPKAQHRQEELIPKKSSNNVSSEIKNLVSAETCDSFFVDLSAVDNKTKNDIPEKVDDKHILQNISEKLNEVNQKIDDLHSYIHCNNQKPLSLVEYVHTPLGSTRTSTSNDIQNLLKKQKQDILKPLEDIQHTISDLKFDAHNTLPDIIKENLWPKIGIIDSRLTMPKQHVEMLDIALQVNTSHNFIVMLDQDEKPLENRFQDALRGRFYNNKEKFNNTLNDLRNNVSIVKSYTNSAREGINKIESVFNPYKSPQYTYISDTVDALKYEVTLFEERIANYQKCLSYPYIPLSNEDIIARALRPKYLS